MIEVVHPVEPGVRVYLMLLGLYVFAWGPLGNQMTLLKMIEATTMPLTSPVLAAVFMGRRSMLPTLVLR